MQGVDTRIIAICSAAQNEIIKNEDKEEEEKSNNRHKYML